MITAEEFFRNKIKEQNPNREVLTLSQELITAEEGMRWAHEFKQLHLHGVVGRSEQLVCECMPDPKCRVENNTVVCNGCNKERR